MKASQRIEHIVVLMLENRSFDQMLGTMPGVDGILDATGKIKPECFNLLDPQDAGSRRYPSFVADPPQYVVPEGQDGPSHSYPAATEQLFGVKTVTVNGVEQVPYLGGAPQTTPASNCGFVKSLYDEQKYDLGEDAAADDAAAAMAAFDRGGLPVIHALAEHFCVCDRWFSAVPGPTEPNRLFTMAATSTGLTYNPWGSDILANQSIYSRLDAANKTWASYGFDLFDTDNFADLKNVPHAHLQMDQFYTDAGNGALPFYSFLCPRYSDKGEGEMANSQHAPYDVRYGEALIADVYEALRSSPAWDKTLFVLVYDEHGGYYDHVRPPAAVAPDGYTSPNAFMQGESAKGKTYLTEAQYTFDFTHLGFRVPAVLISPWVDAQIDSTPYSHTSLLKFIEEMIGQDALTQRDAAATSFAPVIARATPRTDCPKTLPRPTMPGDHAGAADRKPPPVVQEKVSRSTVHLQGHADSGSEVTHTIQTHRALQAYVAKRRQFDAWHVAGEHHAAHAQVYQGKDGKHRWRLVDAGDTVAASTDGYATPADAHDAYMQTAAALQSRDGVTTYQDSQRKHRWRHTVDGDIKARSTDAHDTIEAADGALDRAEFLTTNTEPQVGVLDDAGKAVDWWVLYKLPDNRPDGDGKTSGYEYLYFDENSGPLARSAHTFEDEEAALNRTIAAFKAHSGCGLIYYNDEAAEAYDGMPDGALDGEVEGTTDSSTFGHTKGVLAWDPNSGTAVWILQSTPRYPLPNSAVFPSNENENGQTYLGISLDIDTAHELASIMAVYQQPQVYYFQLPDGTAADDPFRILTEPLDKSVDTHDPKVYDFTSRGGFAFKLMAKNRKWNDEGAEDTRDFWQDLVHPTLGVDLTVETWRRGASPDQVDSGGVDDGTDDVTAIDLRGLPSKVAIDWSYTKDHAKWGVSTTGDWVVIADINDQESQRSRSGGGVAFQHATLWANMTAIEGATVDDPD